MAVGNWDEVRTAYQVARLGTVSGAASVLGASLLSVVCRWALLLSQPG